MARKRAHVPLNVFLNSRHVGVLRREATGAIDFQYGRDWLDWRGTFPVSLSLLLREDRAERQAQAVVKSLPNSFPDQLVTSTMAAISHRTRLIADSLVTASHV